MCSTDTTEYLFIYDIRQNPAICNSMSGSGWDCTKQTKKTDKYRMISLIFGIETDQAKPIPINLTAELPKEEDGVYRTKREGSTTDMEEGT